MHPRHLYGTSLTAKSLQRRDDRLVRASTLKDMQQNVSRFVSQRAAQPAEDSVAVAAPAHADGNGEEDEVAFI